MTDTPIFDALKFREGFDPLEDVTYYDIREHGGRIIRTISIFGGIR